MIDFDKPPFTTRLLQPALARRLGRGRPGPCGMLAALLGGDGVDFLNGNTGTDTANGGPIFDTCRAERRTACEG